MRRSLKVLRRMGASCLVGFLVLGASWAAAEQVNVAPAGTATQSTQNNGYAPELALDGNYDNFTHTTNADTNPTWQDDLGMTLPIEKIILYNRASCCGERLRDITVSILNGAEEAQWTSDLLNPGNALASPASIELDIVALAGAAVDGQIIRVVRTVDPTGGTGPDDASVLALGEVEILVDNASLPVTILDQPQGGRAYIGGCHAFSVTLFNAQNATSISYKWFKDDVEITGATSDKLIVGDVEESDAGTYKVEVTVDGEVLTSDPADLVVAGLNLALGGTASQTITGWGGVAGRAIDGNTDGVFNNGSVTHTNDPADAEAWWQVELYGDSTVDTVVIWGRTDCCWERLSNFRVMALDAEGSEVWGADFFTEPSNPDPTLGGFEVDLPDATVCRTIKIQRLGVDSKGGNYLSLAEVEVFGTGPQAPPPRLENLARGCGVTASQSTTLGGYVAANALNGNYGDFTHTMGTDESPTWQVDLAQMAEIGIIVISNRTSCCGSRLRDITVSILDDAEQVVWESGLLNPENVLGAFPNGPPQLTVDLRLEDSGPVVGQIVRIHRTPDPDFSGGGSDANPDEASILSLGEVEVYAVPECPDEGDTHCDGLSIDSRPPADLPGMFVLAASGSDDSGDDVQYTFTADNGVDLPVVIGPQAENTAVLELLSAGTWTISVRVDDDALCLDEADDATCTEVVDVVAPEGDNLAPAGTATQSTTGFGDGPELAIDGDLTNFSHTEGTDDNSTWQVDLGATASLTAILIHNRDSCCGSRLRDITVSVLDSGGGVVWESGLLNPENELGTFPDGPPVLTLDLATGGPVMGSVVRLVRTPDPDYSGGGDGSNTDEANVLSLGEVLVYGIACPADGDTHCTGLTVEATGGAGDGTFEYLAEATASDDSEDAPIYTFRADNGVDAPLVAGPQAENTALFDLTVGAWTVSVTVDDDPGCDDAADDATCSEVIDVAAPGVGPFLRGDSNGSGNFDLTDGIVIFNYLFLGDPAPGCLAAADTSAQGEVNLTSGVYILNFLFLGGREPPAPYPGCGMSSDPGDMDLGCDEPHTQCP